VTRALLVALAAVLTGCTAGSGDAEPPPAPSVSLAPAPSGTPTPGTPTGPDDPPRLRVGQTVATGLEIPWGLVFLPDGDALVSERASGRVLRVVPDGDTELVGVVPGVEPIGEGGLLGLAVADDDPDTVYTYLTSTAGDNRVLALPFDGKGFGRPQEILTGIPAGGRHNGGRMVFGPDGKLWIGTGEAGEVDLSQDLDNLGGKILRIEPDGSIPDDNPFPDSPIWSYGHRNVQGLAFDSTGQLWASEFGQNRWDELNRIERGGNYGWPVVEGRGGADEGYRDPAAQWRTDEASPSGIAIVGDVVYMAGLRGERLWQIPITADGAGDPVARLTGGFGRLRTVEPAPDGSLWLATSNRDGRGSPARDDDRILVVTIDGS
jgi:glucose/arabinose dehydrogenase